MVTISFTKEQLALLHRVFHVALNAYGDRAATERVNNSAIHSAIRKVAALHLEIYRQAGEIEEVE